MSYIYITTNTINGKKYIGQRNRSSEKDLFYKGSGIQLTKAVKKYGKKNFEKKIIVEGDFNSNLLNNLEIHYIRLHNADRSTNFYNISPGGLNGPKNEGSIYVYNKNSELIDFLPISKALLKYKVSSTTIYVCAKNKKWYHESGLMFLHNKETPEKFKHVYDKEIYHFDLSGKLLNTYSSLNEAANSLNKSRSYLSNACQRPKIISRNYVVSYKDNFFDIKPYYGKTIYQYSSDNQLINQFNFGIPQVTKTFNLPENYVDKYCNNNVFCKTYNCKFSYLSPELAVTLEKKKGGLHCYNVFNNDNELIVSGDVTKCTEYLNISVSYFRWLIQTKSGEYKNFKINRTSWQ